MQGGKSDSRAHAHNHHTYCPFTITAKKGATFLKANNQTLLMFTELKLLQRGERFSKPSHPVLSFCELIHGGVGSRIQVFSLLGQYPSHLDEIFILFVLMTT